MSTPIIAAIRQQTQLHANTRLLAIELAHQASIYGVTRPLAYRYLAQLVHCSPRTAIRQVQRLEACGVLDVVRRKRLVRRCDLPVTDPGYTTDPQRAHERVMRNEMNTYRFRIQWNTTSHRSSSQSCPYDTVSQRLPPQEREKTCGVLDEVRTLKKGLGFCTPGSEVWHETSAKIGRLEALLANAKESPHGTE